MVDNSPSVMILPTTFFDFTQEANEFYFPPLVGSYLRLLRIIVFLISLFITPVWYLMVSEPGRRMNQERPGRGEEQGDEEHDEPQQPQVGPH